MSKYTVSNMLKVFIDRPPEVVFEYVTNTNNTPKWFTGIAEEESSTPIIGVGTRLRNRVHGSDSWSEVEFIEFVPSKSFTLAEVGGTYKCKYTMTPKDGGTLFVYEEWNKSDQIFDAADASIVDNLKRNLERS